MLQVDRFMVEVHNFLKLPRDQARDLVIENMYEALSYMTEDERESISTWVYDFIDRLRSMPGWESDTFEED